VDDEDDDEPEDPVDLDDQWGCSCEKDDDGLVIRACSAHRMSYSAEYTLKHTLDAEIDANLAEMFGKRPVERKEGAVFGNFAIARKR
jgi:hypothetical protein